MQARKCIILFKIKIITKLLARMATAKIKS
jgi:hypothetical protein